MENISRYQAKIPDAHGNIYYTQEEHLIWHELITRQLPVVANRACSEYLRGLEILNLPKDRIPTATEVNFALAKETGWEIEVVPAMISSQQFFSLLAQRKFPAASFIRTREELVYLKEPDLFHELFGHCPLLAHPAYAEFAYTYGKLASNASTEDQEMLARLYWFTIEFGLIKTSSGIRIYGGGILSSMDETPYCLESPLCIRKPFQLLDVLRTPYRIDIKQPIYYIIDNFGVLFELIKMDLFAAIKEARQLGMHQPLFKTDA